MFGRNKKILVRRLVFYLLVLIFFSVLDVKPIPAQPAQLDTCVPGPHSGTLTESQSWCLADSPHTLSGTVTVPEGMTLTIEPGVTVQADDAIPLIVEGELQAEGTSSDPILFTALNHTHDDYRWGGIGINGGSATMSYVTVDFTGAYNIVTATIFESTFRAALSALNGTLTLDHVTLNDSIAEYSRVDTGVMIKNSSVTMTDSTISHIGDGGTRDYAMRVVGEDTVLNMSGSTMTDNTYNLVALYAGAMMNHHTSLTMQDNFDGYLLTETFTIPEGITLTVEPGVTVKAEDAIHLLVEGELQAEGTSPDPILFTALNDTHDDYRWGGIAVDGGSATLSYATVDFTGADNTVTTAILEFTYRAALSVLDGTLALDHITLDDSVAEYSRFDAGLMAKDSSVSLTDSTITDIGDGGDRDYAMRILGSATNLNMISNTLVNNTRDMVLLYPDAMMSADLTLVNQTDFDGYVIEEDFIVPAGISLTIEPGVVFRGGPPMDGTGGQAELIVRGHLEAVGTEAAPILFTSNKDLSPWQWAGLVFDGTDGEGTGNLAYVTVRNAGGDNSIIDPVIGQSGRRGANITAYAPNPSGGLNLDHVTLAFAGQYRGDYGLYIYNRSVSVMSSVIQNNGLGHDINLPDAGIYVGGESQVWIEDSVVQNNFGRGIWVEGDDSFLSVKYSMIAANGHDGLRNTGTATVILSGNEGEANIIQDNGQENTSNDDYGVNQIASEGQVLATYNWWGDASGPTHSGNPAGTGEDVTDRVLYDPWLTEVPDAPTTASLVDLFAPVYVSPGQTMNLGVYLNNVTDETLTNAVLVAQLPKEAKYLYSIPQGEYWHTRHEVIWKLGDLAPGESFIPSITVHQDWGTKPEVPIEFEAGVMAVNLPHPDLDLQTYLDYEGIEILSVDQLTAQEISAALAADADLHDYYQEALDAGFLFYDTGFSYDLSSGQQALVLVMLHPDQLQEARLIYKIGTDYTVVNLSETTLSFFDHEGGVDYDFDMGEWSFYGSWGADSLSQVCSHDRGCEDPSLFECYRNCLLSKVPGWLLDKYFSLYGRITGAASCYACATKTQDCAACGSFLAGELDSTGLLSILERLKDCYDDCDEDPSSHVCSKDKAWCGKHGFSGLLGENSIKKMDCIEEECTYYWGSEYTSCGSMTCEECCLFWQGINPNIECDPGPCDDPDSPNCNQDEIIVTPAFDPNALYGPSQAAPGQVINYTVECENLGEGTAYGVYIVTTLPDVLDDVTLVVDSGGIYYPAIRTLLWEIGELGPGAGEVVNFSAELPSSTPIGSVFSASATVYFPSVPETTPTNDVVTIVGLVAADPQSLETPEETPLDITLTGFAPSGGPLSFSIVSQPLNGTLTGTLPDLTYTPSAGFEGVDRFAFVAQDGDHASSPAEVTILVTTGTESTPPEIRSTYPADGADAVSVYVDPYLDAVYHPTIWARFSEAMNPDSITTATFSLRDSEDHSLDAEVSYNALLLKASLRLSEPLEYNQTYCAVLTTGLEDTSGNPLADAAQWCFSTVEPEFQEFTITASAGLHGSISPAGAVSVMEGADQDFHISPHAGYKIADVIVDGQSVGPLATYTFRYVASDHTISASFSEALPFRSFIPILGK